MCSLSNIKRPRHETFRLCRVDVNNLKNGKEASEVTELGKVNRVKEIRRRGKDGLKINRQLPFVRKKVSRDVSVR